MKIYNIYFSPTGGTKKILNGLTTAWNCEKIEIDIKKNQTILAEIVFGDDDLCFVAVPSFGGRVPDFIIPELKKLKGNNTKSILVTSYGNRAFDDTLLELKEVMHNAGFINIAAIAGVSEHSIMNEFATGRPNSEDLAQLLEFANKCKSIVPNAKKDVIVPGNKPYKQYAGIPLSPKAHSNCTSCGICATSCPIGAIPIASPKDTNKDICITCMHCVSICPVQARKVNKLLKKVGSLKIKKECNIKKSNELFI